MGLFKRTKKTTRTDKEIQKRPAAARAQPQKPQLPDRQAKVHRRAAAPGVLQSPHITEKATDMAEQRQYVFMVSPRANKPEVKKAVERAYDIDVEKVRVLNIPPKPRRLGRTQGRKPGYKKAVVKLRRGQEIELVPR